MFNFNFNRGNIPPFGGEKLHVKRATILSHDIEDVQYEDLSGTSKSKPKKPSSDNKKRTRQIYTAAMDRIKELDVTDACISVMFLSWFKEGAEFYDAHPKSSYSSELEWAHAMQEFHENAVKEVKSKTGDALSMHLQMMMLMTHMSGAKWAEENPPQK